MNCDLTICRCEEVGEREIRAAVRCGLSSMGEVKKATRAGMGLCQGRICGTLVAKILAEETSKKLAEIEPSTIRPPIRLVDLGIMAGGPPQRIS